MVLTNMDGVGKPSTGCASYFWTFVHATEKITQLSPKKSDLIQTKKI